MTNENEQGANGTGVPIPPYISFKTLLTLIKQLKTDGIPPQIDKSVLAKFSGGMQGQLKVALKTLGLLDEGKPTDDLAALVNAFDTPAFEAVLKSVLERTYPYVFAIDLMTATPTMFGDAFKATGAKEDVSRKCRSFFLHAARRAGIPMGNRILTGAVPRASSNGSVRRRPKMPKGKQEPPANDSPAPPPPGGNGSSGNTISDKALEYKLVDLMKEADVGDPERNAIWTLIQYLTRKVKPAPSATTAGD